MDGVVAAQIERTTERDNVIVLQDNCPLGILVDHDIVVRVLVEADNHASSPTLPR